MLTEATPYARARRLWRQAEANQWLVAHEAYHLHNRTEKLKFADALEVSESTVDNLAFAYTLFRELVLNEWSKGQSSEPIQNLRRKHPYTRWMTVYKMWIHHEFELDEARDWLENFEGGNDAMAAEIENKHGAPEWERRANKLYREAGKLMTDIGTPPALQRAAKFFVRVFDRVTKEESGNDN